MNLIKLTILAYALTIVPMAAYADNASDMRADGNLIYNAIKRVVNDHGTSMVVWSTDFNELHNLDCSNDGWRSVYCQAAITSACFNVDAAIQSLKLGPISCKEMAAAMDTCMKPRYFGIPLVENPQQHRDWFNDALKASGCK